MTGSSQPCQSMATSRLLRSSCGATLARSIRRRSSDWIISRTPRSARWSTSFNGHNIIATDAAPALVNVLGMGVRSLHARKVYKDSKFGVLRREWAAETGIALGHLMV